MRLNTCFSGVEHSLSDSVVCEQEMPLSVPLPLFIDDVEPEMVPSALDRRSFESILAEFLRLRLPRLSSGFGSFTDTQRTKIIN